MKVVDKVFIERIYREEGFDLRDFDHLKDEFRKQGITETEATILCDKNSYHVIENVMLDYVHSKGAFKDDPFQDDGYQDVSKGRNIIRKNGLVWYLKLLNDLPEWTMIIIPDKIDLR